MAGEPVTVVRVRADPGRATDEYRVLVDRLWPRGLARAAADFDEWAREVDPSGELRRWYGHLPERFDAFSRRYRAEMESAPAVDAVARLAAVAREQRRSPREQRRSPREQPLVLLTATRDLTRSGAVVLQSEIEPRLDWPGRAGPGRAGPGRASPTR